MKPFLNGFYIWVSDESDPLFIIVGWPIKLNHITVIIYKINFTGFVSDLTSYYDSSIMIVPVWGGSGLRTKILQAMVNKIPIASTRFAAEGLFGEKQSNHFVFFDKPDEFRECLKIKDMELANIARLGYDYYMNFFSPKTLINKRLNVYK